MEKETKEVVKGMKGRLHGWGTATGDQKEDRTREAGGDQPMLGLRAYDKSPGFFSNCKGAFEDLINTAA